LREAGEVASFAQDYSGGLTWSIVGHAGLLAILGMRLISLPAPDVTQVPLAIEATVIDMGEIRRREDAQRQRVAAEQQRQAQLQQQREAAAAEKRRREAAAVAEKKRQQEALALEARRKQEAQRAETARLESQRQAEAERKAEAARKAEAERVALEKQRAEEARIAEQKRREEAERQRIAAAAAAEQERREAERQAQFMRELEAEEQRLAAVSSGKLAQYLALIENRVARNWVRPASAVAGIECVVLVNQIPGGEVVNVRVGSCNGDASVVRSIIAAVEKSSPLPPPADPSLFDRNLRFTFKPEE